MPTPDRYAVIGDPIGHSLSPAMHAAAFRAAGIDATYDAVHVTAGDLPVWLAGAAATYRGINVTIPHKEAVAEAVDELRGDAQALGIVNTVAFGDRTVGYTTDVAGFRGAFRTLDLDPGEAVVLGAGGSARAVVHALLREGMEVTIVNRTLGRAEAIVRAEQVHRSPVAVSVAGSGERIPDVPGGGAAIVALPREGRATREAMARAALIVNTTPAGMPHLPDLSPVPDGVRLDRRQAVVDLVYGRETPLLRLAREAGCRTQDGIEMLVQQGAESFRLWTGVWPDLTVMRRACREELERR